MIQETNKEDLKKLIQDKKTSVLTNTKEEHGNTIILTKDGNDILLNVNWMRGINGEPYIAEEDLNTLATAAGFNHSIDEEGTHVFEKIEKVIAFIRTLEGCFINKFLSVSNPEIIYPDAKKFLSNDPDVLEYAYYDFKDGNGRLKLTNLKLKQYKSKPVIPEMFVKMPTNLPLFFNFLLYNLCMNGRRNIIECLLDDYMELRGLKDEKYSYCEVRDCINFLNQVSCVIYDKPKWNKTELESGEVKLSSGGYIRGKRIYFAFSQFVEPTLKNSYGMSLPCEYFEFNSKLNPNSSYFLHWVSLNYRMNEAKPQENVISIKTLLSKSPMLPTFDKVKKSDRKYYSRIIEPTIRDLNAIKSINYTIENQKKETITDFNSIDIIEFINCKLKIQYDNWPKNKESTRKREAYRLERIEKKERLEEKKEVAAAAAIAKVMEQKKQAT